MVREFVSANRRWLQGVGVLLIIVLLGRFFVLRNHQEIVLEKWHFALILLPFFVIGMIQIVLMYDAWFVRSSEGVLGRLKKAAFFPIALVYMLVLACLVVRFVF